MLWTFCASRYELSHGPLQQVCTGDVTVHAMNWNSGRVSRFARNHSFGVWAMGRGWLKCAKKGRQGSKGKRETEASCLWAYRCIVTNLVFRTIVGYGTLVSDCDGERQRHPVSQFYSIPLLGMGDLQFAVAMQAPTSSCDPPTIIHPPTLRSGRTSTLHAPFWPWFCTGHCWWTWQFSPCEFLPMSWFAAGSLERSPCSFPLCFSFSWRALAALLSNLLWKILEFDNSWKFINLIYTVSYVINRWSWGIMGCINNVISSQ